MKILFILNPIAGNKNKNNIVEEKINLKLSSTQHFYKIIKTMSPKDAIKIANNSNDFDIIVSVGGDGTLSEIINGIKNKNVKIGILPIGTGNDFAKALNIPRDIDKALEIILRGKTVETDVGCINDKLFINSISKGFDAEVVKKTNQMKKTISGMIPYLLSGIKLILKYRPTKVTILLDNKKIERDILLIAVSNGIYYGGGMKISPDSKINDGFFDVCMINTMKKFKIINTFLHIINGKHMSLKEVEYFKAKNIDILSPNNNMINCDGEIHFYDPVSIKMANFKLSFLA